MDKNNALKYTLYGPDGDKMRIEKDGVIRAAATLTKNEYAVVLTASDNSERNVSSKLHFLSTLSENFPKFHVCSERTGIPKHILSLIYS